MISPREFALKIAYLVFCYMWFAKWVIVVGKTSLFHRFFSLCSHIDPYINRGDERDEGKKSNIMRRYNPQSVIRSLSCSSLGRRQLPNLFHFLVGILFSVRSRCSPIRHRANEKQTAQQSNKISSEANDRLGIIDICVEKAAHYQSNGSDKSWVSA